MQVDLTKSQSEELLSSHHYAHLGYCAGEMPYVYPITYVYRDGFLYSYSQEGHKLEAMRNGCRVCIQVEHVLSGFEWQSVMCWGTFEEVKEPKQVQEIKLILADEYGKITIEEGKVPVSPLMKNLHNQRGTLTDASVVYRIKIERMTGRAEQL